MPLRRDLLKNETIEGGASPSPTFATQNEPHPPQAVPLPQRGRREWLFLGKVLFAYFFSERKSKSVCVFLLECRTDCICAGCGVAGTYIDGCCCASVFAVVVNAVGNVANHAVVALAGVLFVFVIHHFKKLLSVSSYIFCTL